MKSLKTFPKGGIHPHEHKNLTEHCQIKSALISQISIVPMAQHLGAPAECLVKPGDAVREGMLIGKAASFISANIHAPVPGTVKELKDLYLPSGMKSQSVIIEMEGEFDRSGKHVETRDWKDLKKDDLLKIIAENGVVGLGGATFPAHVKFSVPKGENVEKFVVNAVECEPYLTADHRLMLEKTKEIFEGIKIIHRLLEPDTVIIGIENNKRDAIALMEAEAKKVDLSVEVVPLKVKYPQGDEKQLLKAVTGKEVPSGALPLSIGCAVANVQTVFAVYEAVVLQKPLLERIVTVSGKALKNPANLKARIGTPIRTLIEECGGFIETPEKIVIGGPMMGFTVYDLDTPVMKGTSGILALSKKEVQRARTSNCLQCGNCIAACPMGLNPTTLYKKVDHSLHEEAKNIGLLDCKECGCCGYVCPAHLPLIQSMRLGKRMLRMKK